MSCVSLKRFCRFSLLAAVTCGTVTSHADELPAPVQALQLVLCVPERVHARPRQFGRLPLPPPDAVAVPH